VPLPFVVVVVVVAVVVVVVVGVVVVGAVVLVAPVVCVKVVVGTDVTVEVVSPPLSAAITTRAKISPSRIATSKAIAHFRPRLIPPPAG